MSVSTKAATKYLGVEHVSVACCSLECHVCLTCNITFGIARTVLLAARETGESFSCPNGHAFSWTPGESKESKLRRQLDNERARSGRVVAERDQLQSKLRTQKGLTTRARNDKARLIARVANGVCPCCNRTFKQLAAHISSQHPQYLETADAPDASPSA